MEHKTFFKKPPPLDLEYEAFVRTLPCCVPGCNEGPSTHHHMESGKPKGSSYSCIPFCCYHHIGWFHGKGIDTTAEKFGLDYDQIIAETMQAYKEFKDG